MPSATSDVGRAGTPGRFRPTASITVLVAAGWTGLSAVQFVAATNLLPRLVGTVVTGDEKVVTTGVLQAGGTVVGVAFGVLVGVLSDRARRRRPWILAGLVTMVTGLLLLPLQGSLLTIGLAWGVVQAGLGTAATAAAALIADHVPRERLGVVSAAIGVGIVAGAIVGTGLVAVPGVGSWGGAALVAALAVLLLAPMGLVRPRSLVGGNPVGGGSGSYRDLALAGGIRLIAGLSNVMLLGFLLFYLDDVVHHPDPTGGQLVLVTLGGVATIAAALVGGAASDRWRRRRALVVVSLLVMAAGQVVLGVWSDWSSTVVAATVFGLGYGGYIAVDGALTTEVLPRRNSLGRDTGLVGIATVAPQIVGPLLAAPLVTALGYGGMYLVAAGVTVAGAALVLFIRSVR